MLVHAPGGQGHREAAADMKTVVAIALACSFALNGAKAATEWALWSAASADLTMTTGSFVDGRTVQFTGFISSIVPPGTSYDAVPIIPGQPDGRRPSSILAGTGTPHPTTIPVDQVIMTIDLTGFPLDAETIFGIADMANFALYRLEVLDDMGNALALSGIQLDHYNLFYPDFTTGTFIADYNVLLDPDTGYMMVDPTHEVQGSTYTHSGLTTFSNFPSGTQLIRILSGQEQPSEGVQFYFGGSAPVPLPAGLWLFLTGLVAATARFARRADPKSNTGNWRRGLVA